MFGPPKHVDANVLNTVQELEQTILGSGETISVVASRLPDLGDPNANYEQALATVSYVTIQLAYQAIQNGTFNQFAQELLHPGNTGQAILELSGY